MHKIAIVCLGVALSVEPSSVVADVTEVRCHMAGQQRSELDLEIVFDTKSRQVTKFASWDELQTLFWGDEVIYWLARGSYSETSPQFALTGYHIETAQLMSYVLSSGDFDTNIIAKMGRSDRPPWNCYRVGL